MHRTRGVLALILTGYLLVLLDVSSLMAALPQIDADLGFSPTGLSWAQNAYTLTFGGLLRSARVWAICSAGAVHSCSESACSRRHRWPSAWRHRRRG